MGRKERFESVDDLNNGGFHVSKQREDLASVADAVGFRENYERGQIIHMHAKWWLWERPAEIKYLCARFHWLMNLEWMEPFAVFEESRHMQPLIEDENDAVFVDIVQLAEDVERVAGRVNGLSLVWLRLLDLGKLARPEDAFQCSLADKSIGAKVDQVLVDWKLKSKLFAYRAVAVPGCQGAYQVIKDGPQLVNRIPEDDSAIRSWYRNIGAVMQCPIILESDSMRMRGTYRLRSDAECGFQIIDMRVGAMYFQP